MRLVWLLALVALAACTKGVPPAVNAPSNVAPSAPAPAPSPKLSQIFTPDVLGANVVWLETITGPAFRTDGSDRTYKVGGCTVIVGATAGKIDNIGIDGYGPACSFPIAQYFAGGYAHPIPPVPTFGDLQQGLGGDYAGDCLRLCGNAGDPVVSLTHEGSHADNFNNLYAAIPITDEPALTAYQAWSDKLAARYGDQALMEGTAKLADSLQAIAASGFGPIRPAVIRVGSKLPGNS